MQQILFIRLLQFILMALCMSYVTACASYKAIPVSTDFWQQKDKTIGVVLVELPDPDISMEVKTWENFGTPSSRILFGGGNHDSNNQPIRLLETQGLQGYLNNTDTTFFIKVQDLFVERLKALGYKAVKIDDRIILKDVPKNQRSSSEYSSKDYQAIGLKNKADVLIILQVSWYGVYCHYVDTYNDYTDVGAWVRGEMVEVKDNKLLWRTGYNRGRFRYSTEGTCNNPGDYAVVVDALNQTLEKSGHYLYDDFFKPIPPEVK